MKKTTIYSLSKELGVSPATVSKALNNSPELNPDTAARIRAQAEERGFRPRPMLSRVSNICALIQTPNAQISCFSPYTVDIMQGMMDYLQSHEIEFSLFSEEIKKLNSGLLLRQLGRRGIKGAALINTNEDSAFYEEFERSSFPYCSLMTDDGKPSRNLLTIDNVDVAFRAVEYLTGIGHQKIAVLVTPAHGLTGTQRLEGYRKAMKAAEIEPDENWIVRSYIDEEELDFGYASVLTLFRAHPELTALFVMGDYVAIGALRAFHHLGLSVPGDVSIIACDDAPETAYLNPPLTVMRIPNRKLGYTAARWIHRQIKEGISKSQPPYEPWMRGELVLRDSTAKPGK